MWDVFANQSENFEISSTPFTVSSVNQGIGVIVNFIIQKLKSKHTSLKKYTN